MSSFQKGLLTEDKKPGIALRVCVCVCTVIWSSAESDQEQNPFLVLNSMLEPLQRPQMGRVVRVSHHETLLAIQGNRWRSQVKRPGSGLLRAANEVSSFQNLSVLLTRTGGLGNSRVSRQFPGPRTSAGAEATLGQGGVLQAQTFISVHFKAPSPRRI